MGERDVDFHRPWELVRRWFSEDQGQDLIEYALLTGAIGFASAVAVTYLGGAMQTTYNSWDSAVQSPDLVEMPDPDAAP